MGQFVGKIAEPVGNVANLLSSGRKRKRSMDLSNVNNEDTNNDTQSPKKKKLLTTTQYIYQTLFKEQKDSDIAIMALGKVWNLHKVYLSQSPYFYSMFNGSWKESCQDFVHVKIIDERITLEALDAVFGSMYSDEIEIDPKLVVSVLATATLFHLDGIIEKCVEVMIENINVETVITYYEAASQYGCKNVEKSTFTWLETNLLSIFSKHQNLLRQISIELMTALVSSHDLYVMQTEFSLYVLLRTWIFLRLHPKYDSENNQHNYKLITQCQQRLADNKHINHNNTYFSTPTFSEPQHIISYFNNYSCTFSGEVLQQIFFLSRRGKRSFLLSPDGQQYLKPFLALRTQYIANHHMDLKIILNDNIIPKEWLHEHIFSHWISLLTVDHLPEAGPQNLDADVFYKNCMRFGRILPEAGFQKWRWTGFHFGLDLIITAHARVLHIRRHHRNEHERLLSLKAKRQFMIRTSVTSINSQRQPIFTQKSEITSLCLEKNEEVSLMVMDAKLVHPLLISMNIMMVPPVSQAFKENVLVSEDLFNFSIPISEIGANCEQRTSTLTENYTDESSTVSTTALLTPSSTASATSMASASSFASVDLL